ncbi:MAG: peptide chain release factor N(5)-glutamine methyltransferase [Lysobacterales bacterium]
MASIADLLTGVEPESRLSAERLLAHRLGRSRSWLFAHSDYVLERSDISDINRGLTRIRAGEPLAYLLGSWEFFSLNLKVTPDTLVPRPETEQLVEQALHLMDVDQALDVLDLGTGSGAIALALAAERPAARLMAVDVCPKALTVARYNAQTLSIANVEFVQGSWWQPLSGKAFDWVVSNPPYVVPGDIRLTARGEPDLALFGGDDGLQAYRAIAQGLPQHLKDGGGVVLEHGLDQRQALMKLFDGQFDRLTGIDDFAGHPRVLVGEGFSRAATR